MQNILRDLRGFLLDPTLYTSPKPRLQKVLPCDLGLGTPCEVVSPNFHALNGWDCMDWPHVTRDLGLGTPCEVVSPNFHDLNG